MTHLGNITLHNFNLRTNFCCTGKKPDLKFHDRGDVNSIRMLHHSEAPIGVMQQLSDCGAADYTRYDAVVEAIVQFLKCAALTVNSLDVYTWNYSFCGGTTRWRLRRRH